MRNQQLVSGENVKTHLPIRYVPPINSDSLVLSAINVKHYVPFEKEEKYILNKNEYVEENFKTESEIIYKIPNVGRTHLANKGLFEDKPTCHADWFKQSMNDEITRNAIYDPRFYGFCSDEWRSYVNNDLGRVEYDYSDVDFVKLPHFITRNVLDNTDEPLHLNTLAVDQYTKMQLEQRETFQNEWLQRRAADRLQRLQYPFHTNGNKTS